MVHIFYILRNLGTIHNLLSFCGLLQFFFFPRSCRVASLTLWQSQYYGSWDHMEYLLVSTLRGVDLSHNIHVIPEDLEIIKIFVLLKWLHMGLFSVIPQHNRKKICHYWIKNCSKKTALSFPEIRTFPLSFTYNCSSCRQCVVHQKTDGVKMS